MANKCDLGGRGEWADVSASARTGAGVRGLGDAIARRLVPRIPAAGTPVPITERQVSLLAGWAARLP